MSLERGSFQRTFDVHGAESYRTGYLKLKSVLHDRATGLPAFPVLFDTLRAALDQRRQVGVLHLELGDVDLVESLYGWQVFDEVVEHVAVTLRRELPGTLPAGSLLSVSGVAGDRFVVFVLEQADGREVDARSMTACTRALQRSVERALEHGPVAGLAVRPAPRVGQALLSLNPFYRFERRVYAAIEDARNSVERRERRRERSWGEELTEIIRNAEVRPFLQPVVNLSARGVLGFEAFVRGPSQSMFEAPQAMFALSTRLGSVGELDRLCLAEALRASSSAAWDGKLFVNVLPESLAGADGRAGGFRDLVLGAGFDPRKLVVELSERWGDDDPERLVAAFAAARKEGLRMALDDVGTGRHSRELVERVRPDYVKLDVSLVRDVHRNLIKQEVASSLVRLAAAVGADVIAEGVEHDDEALVLERSGARYAQGFLFAIPAPAETALRRAARPK